MSRRPHKRRSFLPMRIPETSALLYQRLALILRRNQFPHSFKAAEASSAAFFVCTAGGGRLPLRSSAVVWYMEYEAWLDVVVA